MQAAFAIRPLVVVAVDVANEAMKFQVRNSKAYLARVECSAAGGGRNYCRDQSLGTRPAGLYRSRCGAICARRLRVLAIAGR